MQYKVQKSPLAPEQDLGVSVAKLITLRWVAVLGQFLTEGIAYFVFQIDFPVIFTFLLTLFLAVNNVLLYVWMKGGNNTRISTLGAFWILLSDLLQLMALMFINGGFNNPFVSVMVAPVAVSASMFSLRYTVIMTGIAGVLSLLLSLNQLQHLTPDLYSVYMVYGIPKTDLYIFGLIAGQLATLVFISFYVMSITHEKRKLAHALIKAQNDYNTEREISLMGSLATATAHELGTPLNTIMLIADDLKSQIQDKTVQTDLDELALQTQRCGDILSQLGDKIKNTKAMHAERFLSDLVNDIAQQQISQSLQVNIIYPSDNTDPEPTILHTPEFVNGLGNLLKNAGQFAQSTVDIYCIWNTEIVTITITDDGIGFSKGILFAIGTPFMSSRRGKNHHMGLGLFVAQTLLDRTHGTVTFANTPSGGASVSVVWNRSALDTRWVIQRDS